MANRRGRRISFRAAIFIAFFLCGLIPVLAAGRVLVNGKTARASYDVKVGDIIEIGFGEKTVRAEVLAVAETVRKENAAELFRYIG